MRKDRYRRKPGQTPHYTARETALYLSRKARWQRAMLINPAKRETRGDKRLFYYLSDRGPANTGGHWIVTAVKAGGRGGGGTWLEPNASDTACYLGGASPPMEYTVSDLHPVGDVGNPNYFLATNIGRFTYKTLRIRGHAAGVTDVEDWAVPSIQANAGGTLVNQGPSPRPGYTRLAWSTPLASGAYSYGCVKYICSVVGSGDSEGYRGIYLQGQIRQRAYSGIYPATLSVSPAFSNIPVALNNFAGFRWMLGWSVYFNVYGVSATVVIDSLELELDNGMVVTPYQRATGGPPPPEGYFYNGGQYAYTCTCPDLNRKSDALASAVFPTEHRARDWSGSNAGIRDAPCKHILSAARNLDDLMTLFVASSAGANDLPAREYWVDPLAEWCDRNARRREQDQAYADMAQSQLAATESDRKRAHRQAVRTALNAGKQAWKETVVGLPRPTTQEQISRDPGLQALQETFRQAEELAAFKRNPVVGIGRAVGIVKPPAAIRPMGPKAGILRPRPPRTPRPGK